MHAILEYLHQIGVLLRLLSLLKWIATAAPFHVLPGHQGTLNLQTTRFSFGVMETGVVTWPWTLASLERTFVY